MFKVSGATVYPSEVEAALREIDGVRAAFVTEVDGRVGAAVVGATSVDELRSEARKLLSSFKVPTVWLLARLRRRRAARWHRQGRRSAAAGNAGRHDPLKSASDEIRYRR